MKRFKISAVLLSTCLALGAFAGCSQSSASPAKPDGTVANINENFKINVSEGVASEISEVVYDDADALTSGSPVTPVDDSDAPAATDNDSAPAVNDENVDPEAARQEYANKFVSAFAEQFIHEMDVENLSVEELMGFVHIHLKINSTDLISYEPKGEMLYETFTLASAHDVIKDYFGIYTTDVFGSELAVPPDAHGDQPAGPFFADGKIWYEASDGENHNLIAIVDSTTPNEDGTLTLNFTVYEIDWDTYSALNSAGLMAYYKLTPEEASADSTLNIVTNGSAVVRVSQSGDYYLSSYKTDK